MARDPLVDWITVKTRVWRGEPEPSPDVLPLGGQGYTGPPLGWDGQPLRPPEPVESVEPAEPLVEERAEYRVEPGPLQRRSDDAVDRWFVDRTPVRPEDIGHGPDDSDSLATVAVFIDQVYASADELAALGETPESRLAWAVSCSPQDWSSACQATSWPVSVRPSLSDLSPAARLEAVRLGLGDPASERAGRRIL